MNQSPRTPPQVVIAKDCVISMDNKSYRSLINENQTSDGDTQYTNVNKPVGSNRRSSPSERIPSVFQATPPVRSPVSSAPTGIALPSRHEKKLSSTSPDFIDDGTYVSDYNTEDDSIEQLCDGHADDSDSDIDDAFAREQALERGCLISATLQPIIQQEDNNNSSSSLSKKRKSYSDTESDDYLIESKKRPAKSKRVVFFREDTMEDDDVNIREENHDIYEIGMDVLEADDDSSDDSESCSMKSTDDSIDDILENVATETYTADVTLPRVFSLRRERYLNMEIDSSKKNEDKDRVSQVAASSKQTFSVYKGFTVYETVNMTSIVHGQKSPVASPNIGIQLVPDTDIVDSNESKTEKQDELINSDNNTHTFKKDTITKDYHEKKGSKSLTEDSVDFLNSEKASSSLSKTNNKLPPLPPKKIEMLNEIEREALDFFGEPPPYESIYREPSPELYFEKAVENMSDNEEASSLDWDTHDEDDEDDEEGGEDGDDESEKAESTTQWDQGLHAKEVTLKLSKSHSPNSSVGCIGEDRTISVASLDQEEGSERSFSSSQQTSDSDGSAFSRDDEEYEQPFSEIINETKMLTKSIMSAFATMTERENSLTFSDLIDTTVSESDCSMVSSGDWDAATTTVEDQTSLSTPTMSFSREQSVGSASTYSRSENVSTHAHSSLSSREQSVGSTASYGSYDTTQQYEPTIHNNNNIITTTSSSSRSPISRTCYYIPESQQQTIAIESSTPTTASSQPGVNTFVDSFDKIRVNDKSKELCENNSKTSSSPNLQTTYVTPVNEQERIIAREKNVRVQSSSVKQINKRTEWQEKEENETELGQNVLSEKWSMKTGSLPRLHNRLEVKASSEPRSEQQQKKQPAGGLSLSVRPLSPAHIQKIRLVALPDHDYTEQQVPNRDEVDETEPDEVTVILDSSSSTTEAESVDTVASLPAHVVKEPEQSKQINNMAPMYQITRTYTSPIGNNNVKWDDIDEGFTEVREKQIPEIGNKEYKVKQIKIPDIFTQTKEPRVNQKYLVMSPTVKEAIYYEDYIASPLVSKSPSIFDETEVVPMEVVTASHAHEDQQVKPILSHLPCDPAISVHVNDVNFVKAKPIYIDTTVKVNDEYVIKEEEEVEEEEEEPLSPVDRIFSTVSSHQASRDLSSSSSDDDGTALKVPKKVKASQYHSSENILLTSETTAARAEVAPESKWEGESLPIKEQAYILHKPTSDDDEDTSSSIESLLMHISADADDIELAGIISDSDDLVDDDDDEPPEVPPRSYLEHIAARSSSTTTTTKTTSKVTHIYTNIENNKERQQITRVNNLHSPKLDVQIALDDANDEVGDGAVDVVPNSPSPVQADVKFHQIPVKSESTVTYEPLQRSDVITERNIASPHQVNEAKNTNTMVTVEYEQTKVYDVVSPEPENNICISNVLKSEDDKSVTVTTVPLEPAKSIDKSISIANYRELLTLDIKKQSIEKDGDTESSGDVSSPDIDAFIRSPSSEAVNIPGYTSDEYLGSAETVIFQPSPARENIGLEAVLSAENISSAESKESLSSQSTVEGDSQPEITDINSNERDNRVPVKRTVSAREAQQVKQAANSFNQVTVVNKAPAVSERVAKYEEAVIETTLHYEEESPQPVENVTEERTVVAHPVREEENTEVFEETNITRVITTTKEQTALECSESALQFECRPYKSPDELVHEALPLNSPTVVQPEAKTFNKRRLSSFETEAQEQDMVELSETTEQFEVEISQPDERIPQSPMESATANPLVQVIQTWEHDQSNFSPTILSTAQEKVEQVTNESAEEYEVDSSDKSDGVVHEAAPNESSLPAVIAPATVVERVSPQPTGSQDTVHYVVPSLSELSKTAIMIPLISKTDRKRTIASVKPKPVQLQEPQPITTHNEEAVTEITKEIQLRKTSRPVTLSSRTTVNLKEAGVQMSSPFMESISSSVKENKDKIHKAEAIEVCEVSVLPDQLENVQNNINLNQIPDDVKDLIPEVTKKLVDDKEDGARTQPHEQKLKKKNEEEKFDETIKRIEKHVKKMGNVSIEKRNTQKELCKTSMDTCASCTAKGEVVSEEVTTKEMTLVFVWPKGCKPKALDKDSSIYRELFSRKVTRISDYNAKEKKELEEHQKRRKAICSKDHGPEALL